MQITQRLSRSKSAVQGAQRPRSTSVCCAMRNDSTPQTARREMLLAAGGLLLGSQLARPDVARAEKLRIVELEVKNLSSFQKGDELQDYRQKAEAAIKSVITKDDAADAVRIALRCAGTYDVNTKTGGFNGSIFLNPDELARPENASVRPIAEKLKKAKAAVDAAVTPLGSAPISYSDLMVLAAKVAVQAKWLQEKLDAGNKDTVQFASPWAVTLGRTDSPMAGPNHLPADDASVEEIRAALSSVGVKSGDQGFLAAKPPLWEKPGFLVWCAAAKDGAAEEARFAAADPVYENLKKKYDISRRTVTRTNYEVDFIDFFTRATTLGAKFDASVYLHPMKIQSF